MADHTYANDFDIPAPQLAGGVLKARYTMDFSRDAAFGRSWVAVFVVITLPAGVLVAAGSRWHAVRRALQPLHALVAQTRAISPSRLDQCLHRYRPGRRGTAALVEQFNALMDRLQRAVSQLEAFQRRRGARAAHAAGRADRPH